MLRMCLIGLFFLMCGAATAEVTPQLSRMYCAPTPEMELVLQGYDKVMQGASGVVAGSAFAEVWVKQTGAGFFIIQRMDDEGLSCVVLGGDILRPVIKGDPA